MLPLQLHKPIEDIHFVETVTNFIIANGIAKDTIYLTRSFEDPAMQGLVLRIKLEYEIS